MAKIITVTKSMVSIDDLEETLNQYRVMGFNFKQIIPYKYHNVSEPQNFSLGVLGMITLDYVLIIFEKETRNDKPKYEKV